MKLQPFDNETQSISLSDLTIENRLDQLEIYGSLSITRDQAGLALALGLTMGAVHLAGRMAEIGRARAAADAAALAAAGMWVVLTRHSPCSGPAPWRSHRTHGSWGTSRSPW